MGEGADVLPRAVTCGGVRWHRVTCGVTRCTPIDGGWRASVKFLFCSYDGVGAGGGGGSAGAGYGLKHGGLRKQWPGLDQQWEGHPRQLGVFGGTHPSTEGEY